MISGNKRRRPVTIPDVTEGQPTALDSGTPNGLFEAANGNRYLITHDDDGPEDRRFAIVLRHLNLERFTTLELTAQSLEHGVWRGAYRLRLNHSFGGEAPYREPGHIGIDVSGIVMLTCRGTKRHPDWLALGNVGEKKGTQVCSPYGKDWCDFDGWAIEASETGRSIFSHTPDGQRSWLLDVQPLKPSFT